MHLSPTHLLILSTITFLSTGVQGIAVDSLCPANERYSTCGSACAPTCDDLLSRAPKQCMDVCEVGCFCNPGYLRDDNGRCIPEKECPRECGANQEFSYCGTACETTCDDLALQEPRMCITVCVPGCVCLPDYVIDTKTEQCVLPENCPKPGCEIGDDWSVVGASAAECAVVRFSCNPGFQHWSDGDCGCGCKPIGCEIGDNWSVVGESAAECAVILFSCNPGFKHWSDGDCGCGCKPIECSPCVLSRAPIIECIGGPRDAFEGPSGVCVVNEDGQCAEVWDKCPCGGPEGWTCNAGDVCVAVPGQVHGVCEPSNDCFLEENECNNFFDCPRNQICKHPDDNLCGNCYQTDDQCTGDLDCSYGEVCEFTVDGCECNGSRKCVTMCTISGCPEHQECNGRLCRPVSCEDARDCESGQCCVNGKCSSDPGVCSINIVSA